MGGVRVIFEWLNRLSRRGWPCSLAAVSGERIVTWMPIEFEIVPFEYMLERMRSATARDVLLATEINTWKIVSLMPGGRKFAACQMLEHLFFLKSNPIWAQSVERYLHPQECQLRPIAISSWLKLELERRGHVDVPIVPNGVNRTMFFPDPRLRETYAFDPSKFVVLIEGHLANEAKDVERMAMRAARILRSYYGDRLVVWGVSQYPPYMDFDMFWRSPTQTELRTIYSSAHMLLKASRFEGRSCVDLEAMACGLPVCRAIQCGDDDLLHGYNCLVSPYGDLEAFVANARCLIDSAELRAQLSRNGLEYAARMDWERSIDLLEGIFGC